MINNLGHLFYEFLIYYGFYFDPKENIVDLKEIYKNIDILERTFNKQHNDLIIIDPLNSTNNVAKNTILFPFIKLSFSLGTKAAIEKCKVDGIMIMSILMIVI